MSGFYEREDIDYRDDSIKERELANTTSEGEKKRLEAYRINPYEYRKDQGKLPIAEITNQFPHALEELAKVIAFGERKYKRHSWVKVPDFINRAENSAQRHGIARAKGINIDPESECLHLAHQVWNYLAMLEYQLTFVEKKVVFKCEKPSQSIPKIQTVGNCNAYTNRPLWKEHLNIANNNQRIKKVR